MSQETKKCPYCGEEIDINAEKCKLCGKFLNKSKGKTNPNNIDKNNTATTSIFISIVFIIFILLKLGMKCVGYQYRHPSSNNMTKSDYIGNWDDLYSQRANLSIAESGIGNQLKVDIRWSSSAVSGTEWGFNCDFQEQTGELMCKGMQFEHYALCDGKKIDNAGEADECYLRTGEKYKEVTETIYEDRPATIKIIKGNLVTILENNEDIGKGYKNEIIKNSENMTLYVNITNDDSLEKCIFAKYKE